MREPYFLVFFFFFSLKDGALLLVQFSFFRGEGGRDMTFGLQNNSFFGGGMGQLLFGFLTFFFLWYGALLLVSVSFFRGRGGRGRHDF